MNKSQQQKRGERRHGPGRGGAGVEIELERLRRRFEAFRRGHEPGTRIPDALRAAALAAADRGASEADLRRACQSTSVQLRQWRQWLRRGAQVDDPADQQVARVFEVVDEPPASEPEIGPGCDPRIAELELRLGRWAVRISQLAD
jgi:transposase-like protein